MELEIPSTEGPVATRLNFPLAISDVDLLFLYHKCNKTVLFRPKGGEVYVFSSDGPMIDYNRKSVGLGLPIATIDSKMQQSIVIGSGTQSTCSVHESCRDLSGHLVRQSLTVCLTDQILN